MAVKQCTQCLCDKDVSLFRKDVTYKSGRRNYCTECYNRTRSTVQLVKPKAHYRQAAVLAELPRPEDLPAAYMKRVSDYWTSLVGGEEPTRRII